MGSVQASAAAPAMATINRMPALVRWNASRMFGVRTLKALWVAWSSSSIANSTPRGNSETPAAELGQLGSRRQRSLDRAGERPARCRGGAGPVPPSAQSRRS